MVQVNALPCTNRLNTLFDFIVGQICYVKNSGTLRDLTSSLFSIKLNTSCFHITSSSHSEIHLNIGVFEYKNM